MDTVFEDLTKRLIDLPRHQRLILVKLLLDLDQQGSAKDMEMAWDDEIRARIKAIDEGRVIGVPYADIERELDARSRKR